MSPYVYSGMENAITALIIALLLILIYLYAAAPTQAAGTDANAGTQAVDTGVSSDTLIIVQPTDAYGSVGTGPFAPALYSTEQSASLYDDGYGPIGPFLPYYMDYGGGVYPGRFTRYPRHHNLHLHTVGAAYVHPLYQGSRGR